MKRLRKPLQGFDAVLMYSEENQVFAALHAGAAQDSRRFRSRPATW